MKLRTQISLLLFLFGLVPLLIAYAVNVPTIFDRIEALYHKAHLQNLRAGFSDLDQHIARRNEMVRLLAKMPEPGLLLSDEEPDNARAIAKARLAYADWVNQVLFDQVDITRILFLDEDGLLTLGLKRNRPAGKLEPLDNSTERFNSKLIEEGLRMRSGVVMTGPIEFGETQQDASPSQWMQLGLVSPVFRFDQSENQDSVGKKSGVVVVYLDMGGLANAYRGIYWAHSDGHYLGAPAGAEPAAAGSAFEDFSGLEEVFRKGELGLWEFEGQQVLWVPLFDTVDTGPLWVGRSVDPSPITELRLIIEGRVVIVAIGLLLVVFVVARLIALRTERLGHELKDGISQVLEQDEPVTFSWQRPEELHELGSNLTRLAETHAQHSKALRDYASELEASNLYKSEFLANVSHELRTPLNSILLLSKMLADSNTEKIPGEQNRQARIIHSAGSDLKALIDNILDLSRIDAMQLTLVAETVELEPMLLNIVELMKPQFDEKHLELKLDIDVSAPHSVIVDSEKLRQILINFLSNAVKFTEQGRVTVRLLPGHDSQGRYWPVAISVADTGIGIPASKGEKIFEAFKQADGSTSRRFGGTGLGLTISRELAHLMGGHIEMESEPGSGSTFTLMLPAEVPEMAEDAGMRKPVTSRNDHEHEQPLPQADYRNARVLVVDDDVRNLLALTPLLEKWKLDVMAAGDGREALETLATGGDFDLVFMDIMMPEMDGYEVIRHLREQDRFAGLPIVALTAKAGPDDREQCLAAGADDCIVKPIDPLELKTKLDKYLAGAVSGEPPGGGGVTGMKRYAGFRVLIVDDNANNLYTLRSLINKHMDVEVLEADSGQAALDIALKNPRIDLIVLDIQMPEMDGFQTASMLKVRQKTRDIPIIFLTAAYKTDEFQQKGYEVGAADYLLKPIDDNQLINKISTYLRLIEKEREMNRQLELLVEQRTAELRLARNYLQNVINNMGEALLLLEPSGRIKAVNPAACGMLGYQESDLIGMAIGDVFEEEATEQANAFMGVWLEALIRTGTISSIEACFIASDQRRVPILFSRTAMMDEAGKITDIICIAKDMTGYKRVDDGSQQA